MDKEISKEDMVKEAVEEAKKATEEYQDITEEVEQMEQSTDDAEKTEKKKDKKFKRKPKKDKKEEQIEELSDKLVRQIAEFDNFRKRTDKEKSQMYEIGARDVIEKILPVVDNFERGLLAVSEDDKGTPFVEGMDMIYKQLLCTLEDIGVKPVEAVGQEFNLELHNAVLHVDDEAYGENEVIEELQKGYIYRDTVVRHSMVKVAN